MRYNQTVQMICNLAKNKGVISRRFFLEGLKVLLNSKKKMGFYEFRSVGNVIANLPTNNQANPPIYWAYKPLGIKSSALHF